MQSPLTPTMGYHLPGLEEELMLDGLSLEGEHDALKAGGVSPRTIKRPTNPVATCLEKNSSRLTLAHPLLGGPDDGIPLGAAAKRPRLGPISLPGAPLSPHLSRGSSSNSHSAGPSNSPSAQASPVHGMRPAFATRPQTNYEGLAEPRPVLANFSTALPPPVTPFGTPPGIQSMPHGRNLPPPDVAVTPDAPLGNSFGGCAEPISDRPSRLPSQSGSPVAIATSSIHHHLRLGPPLPHAFMRGPDRGLLPPSLDGRGIDGPTHPSPAVPSRPSVGSSCSGGSSPRAVAVASGRHGPDSAVAPPLAGSGGIGSTSGGARQRWPRQRRVAAAPVSIRPGLHASSSTATPPTTFGSSGGLRRMQVACPRATRRTSRSSIGSEPEDASPARPSCASKPCARRPSGVVAPSSAYVLCHPSRGVRAVCHGRRRVLHPPSLRSALGHALAPLSLRPRAHVTHVHV